LVQAGGDLHGSITAAGNIEQVVSFGSMDASLNALGTFALVSGMDEHSVLAQRITLRPEGIPWLADVGQRPFSFRAFSGETTNQGLAGITLPDPGFLGQGNILTVVVSGS